MEVYYKLNSGIPEVIRLHVVCKMAKSIVMRYILENCQECDILLDMNEILARDIGFNNSEIKREIIKLCKDDHGINEYNLLKIYSVPATYRIICDRYADCQDLFRAIFSRCETKISKMYKYYLKRCIERCRDEHVTWTLRRAIEFGICSSIRFISLSIVELPL